MLFCHLFPYYLRLILFLKVLPMSEKGSFLYYLSAAMAIIGTVGYHFFVKKISPTINPLVSLTAIYMAVFAICIPILLLFPIQGGLVTHMKQLSWVQLGIAGAVILMELGFLLMYRQGWDLSLGNVVTGVVINIILMVIGLLILKEKINLINIVGIILSMIGVAMISYRRS